ncbi:hypothetical protein [Mesobacillus boroniphilus]|nr:hypothetical protein [Mesobacillus boroniphilus]
MEETLKLIQIELKELKEGHDHLKEEFLEFKEGQDGLKIGFLELK